MRSNCAIANGLDLVGDRWSLLILRDLMFTNRCEFGHFLNAGEGIASNILSERLKRLQQGDLIKKARHPHHGKKFVYSLSDKGLRLAPVLIELMLWSYENISGTFIPPQALHLIKKDRAALLERVQRREPLLVLNLKA